MHLNAFTILYEPMNGALDLMSRGVSVTLEMNACLVSEWR